MAKHGIAIRCWTCGTVHDINTPAAVAMPACCFDSIMEIAASLGRTCFAQLPFHFERIANKQAELNDAVADAAILSSNPDVRRMALKWRND